MLYTGRASYIVLDEPNIEFGEPRRGNEPLAADPQLGLAEFGPYSLQLGGRWHPPTTTLVPIAADDDFDEVADTLDRMNGFTRVKGYGTYARTDFLGYEQAYRSKLVVRRDVDGQVLARSAFDKALSERDVGRGFKRLIDQIQGAVEQISQNDGDAVVVIYLPKDIVTQFRSLTPNFRTIKQKKKKKNGSGKGQLMLFEEVLGEGDDNAEETLYQDLRRAIKVRAMQRQVAVQVLTDSFLVEESSQPWAGKFWNVSCSLYCKAGGIPWRLPTDENIAHCGIRFGVSKDAEGTRVLVGVAQVFSASGELVALRAGKATRGSRRKSEAGYYLTYDQAFQLVTEAIDDYELVTGRIPDRLMVHKSSPFKEEEIQGIEAAQRGIRETDMVYIKGETPFRLLPPGGQPCYRGTVVPTSDDSALVYLSGFIESEGSWRGKHIPAPVEIVRCKSHRSLLDLAEEVLRLTKMNWNTTIFATRHPSTFANASEMIGMMKELKAEERLAPQIRYYI